MTLSRVSLLNLSLYPTSLGAMGGSLWSSRCNCGCSSEVQKFNARAVLSARVCSLIVSSIYDICLLLVCQCFVCFVVFPGFCCVNCLVG